MSLLSGLAGAYRTCRSFLPYLTLFLDRWCGAGKFKVSDTVVAELIAQDPRCVEILASLLSGTSGAASLDDVGLASLLSSW